MACLFAARLAGAQVPIIMLGSWQAGLQGLDKYGVRLVEADGHETAYPVQVTHNPSDCVGVRNALVLVKSWGTERAAHQLSTCLAPDGIALTSPKRTWQPGDPGQRVRRPTSCTGRHNPGSHIA